MKNIENEKCIDCEACIDCCPNNAIASETNEKGFYHVSIDLNKCIHCGICKNVCPQMETKSLREPVEAYSYVEPDVWKRMSCQSGGVFSSAAEYAIGNGWIVYGVIMDDTEAKYVRADELNGVSLMKGSKYIQAKSNDVLKFIKEDLLENRKVLFCGTPCMVSGVNNYLEYHKIDTINFYTIDIICHGVPSSKIFKEYVNYLKDKYGECKNFNFRDKLTGWHGHICSFFVGNTKYYSFDYVKIFYSNLILNESCYCCPYSSNLRAGDITIGDLWVEDVNYKIQDDNIGTSLLLVNTKKGEDLKTFVDKKGLCAVDISKCLQHNLKAPTPKNKKYRDFWKNYKMNGFHISVGEYITNNFTEIPEEKMIWEGYKLDDLVLEIKNYTIFLYGIGLTMLQIISYLKKNDLEVCGVANLSKEYVGQVIDGIPVVNTSYINTIDDAKIIICSRNLKNSEIIKGRLINEGFLSEKIVKISDYEINRSM